MYTNIINQRAQNVIMTGKVRGQGHNTSVAALEHVSIGFNTRKKAYDLQGQMSYQSSLKSQYLPKYWSYSIGFKTVGITFLVKGQGKNKKQMN